MMYVSLKLPTLCIMSLILMNESLYEQYNGDILTVMAPIWHDYNGIAVYHVFQCYDTVGWAIRMAFSL